MAIDKEKLVLGGLRRLLNGTARMTRRGAGRIGYYLLTSPRRLAEEPEKLVFLESAQQHTIELEGQQIQTYHWPGKGPAVLLLHGWESSTARWFELFPALQQADYDIYAIDAPAHGKSGGKRFTVFAYCQVLDAYFRQLPKIPDYWIGHSGGGMAAIYYCSRPEYAFCPQRIISMAVPGELENFIDKFCDFVGANERVKYGIGRRFQKNMKHTIEDINFIEFVKELAVPGLIIHDEDDDVAPIAGAFKMHQNWKGSELVTTRGRGHSLTGKFVPAIIVEYLTQCRKDQ